MKSFSSLEVLFSFSFPANVCRLTNLKELQLSAYKTDENDLKPIAMNLINLERLSIEGTIDQLLSFLRHSRTLKLAILDDRRTPSNALNVLTMNEVRRIGGMKSKVRIGVSEKQYLATKWKWNCLSHNLVEIIRVETIREYFDYNTLQLDY